MNCLQGATACLAASLLAAAAHAAPPSAAVKAEIDGLFKALQASGCEFQRNGTWHSGAEALPHLATKLAHLERRDAIRSAEDFITLGASESSLSGRPYQVRCAGAEPVNSRGWLLQRLQTIRQGK